MDIRTNHEYYCRLARWNDNDTPQEYDNFDDFYDDWNNNDLDLNLLFRYDIMPKYDEEDRETGKYQMELFFILQRKGLFVPISIKYVDEKDIDKINEYLKPRWEHMKQLWQPISE